MRILDKLLTIGRDHRYYLRHCWYGTVHVQENCYGCDQPRTDNYYGKSDTLYCGNMLIGPLTEAEVSIHGTFTRDVGYDPTHKLFNRECLRQARMKALLIAKTVFETSLMWDKVGKLEKTKRKNSLRRIRSIIAHNKYPAKADEVYARKAVRNLIVMRQTNTIPLKVLEEKAKSKLAKMRVDPKELSEMRPLEYYLFPRSPSKSGTTTFRRGTPSDEGTPSGDATPSDNGTPSDDGTSMDEPCIQVDPGWD